MSSSKEDTQQGVVDFWAMQREKASRKKERVQSKGHIKMARHRNQLEIT
jgi:hypothetical protein